MNRNLPTRTLTSQSSAAAVAAAQVLVGASQLMVNDRYTHVKQESGDYSFIGYSQYIDTETVDASSDVGVGTSAMGAADRLVDF